MDDRLILLPIIDAALRRQAQGAADRGGHRLGRFRRDARKMLRASCAGCRERIVVDESRGLISGAMVVSPCAHRVVR
jgi:hypothetical protein